MGMDTMVFFNVRDLEVCARSTPKAVAPTGHRMEFTADLNQMHLLDPESGQVV
jgi:multiple sugar transport system ATP-binding protein